MDAAAYQRAFDMEQLAILCANYDRQIDSLDVENRKLRKMVKECHELLQDILAGCSLHPFTVKVMEQRMRELGVDA